MEKNRVKRVLITGSAGFIGSHVVEHFLANTDWDIVALVRLSHVGDLARIAQSKVYQQNKHRVRIVHHDLLSPINETIDSHIGHVDYVLHLAANSHVDRSITHPVEFFYDNVIGTANLLEWARFRNGFINDKGLYEKYEDVPIKKFINAGTDEVFGPVRDGVPFVEDSPFKPSNPYSAAKAGQCDAGHAYFITFGLPVVTTYMVNIFGERQNPEKLIPKTMKKLLNGGPMTVHCKIETGEAETTDSSIVSEIGIRCWMHARNAADGYKFLLENGVPGEAYNLEAGVRKDNLEIIKLIADELGVEAKLVFQDFHSSRPGHDREYGLDGTKIRELGWVAPVSFEDSLRKTIQWTMENKDEWL